MLGGDFDSDTALDSALALVATERGIDFRDYRRETLRNRLAYRIEATRASDPATYVHMLENEPGELDRLVSAFLIAVTSFNRDPDVFAALEDYVLPAIVAAPPRPSTARAWCVGVATGEEAYSLAMSFTTACAAREGSSFEVLATDLDAASIATARRGRYALEASSALPERAATYWSESSKGLLEISADLRDRVTFAQHDFLGPRLAPLEAVVAEFDLVLLRNVLIYVEERQQRLGLERVAGTLKAGGILVLGISEDIPDRLRAPAGPFEVVDARLRIFRRCEDNSWR